VHIRLTNVAEAWAGRVGIGSQVSVPRLDFVHKKTNSIISEIFSGKCEAFPTFNTISSISVA
jgi:hypothetical protein